MEGESKAKTSLTTKAATLDGMTVKRARSVRRLAPFLFQWGYYALLYDEKLEDVGYQDVARKLYQALTDILKINDPLTSTTLATEAIKAKLQLTQASRNDGLIQPSSSSLAESFTLHALSNVKDRAVLTWIQVGSGAAYWDRKNAEELAFGNKLRLFLKYVQMPNELVEGIVEYSKVNALGTPSCTLYDAIFGWLEKNKRDTNSLIQEIISEVERGSFPNELLLEYVDGDEYFVKYLAFVYDEMPKAITNKMAAKKLGVDDGTISNKRRKYSKLCAKLLQPVSSTGKRTTACVWRSNDKK
jgi:hypothetical protein